MRKQTIPREVLLALHECEGIGWMSIGKVLEAEGAAEAARWRAGDWRRAGLTARQAEAAVERLRPEAEARAEAWRNRWGVRVVTRLDAEYPPMLQHIPEPPWVLYTVGDVSLLSRPAVAIVGTRTATAYGRRVAEDLAAACAAAGLTVVSGLARGIDTAAHVGALRQPGGTAAVLATPLDRVYPAENRPLFRSIAEQGVLVSETPPDTVISKGLFLRRNRIIAGLSLGVVVVEAGERSGALKTANYAQDSNRDLFVVPGPITSPRSRGTNAKLKESCAKIVLGPEDILEEYRRRLNPSDRDADHPQAAGIRGEPLTPDEEKVLELLLESPRTIDELAEAGGLPIGLLHAVLLTLQIKRKITKRPGSVYSAF